jgi:hypothetical protein
VCLRFAGAVIGARLPSQLRQDVDARTTGL